MIVIFDTNAYRDIVHNLTYEKSCELIDTIKEAETQIGWHPNMCLSVSRELISNFTSNNLKLECANAARIQYRHCMDSDVNELRILPLPEDQIAHCFYQVQDQDFSNNQNLLVEIIGDVVSNDIDKTIGKYTNEIKLISDFVHEVENEYSQSVISFIKGYVGENYKKDKPFNGHSKELKEYKEYLKDKESVLLGIADARLKEIESRLIEDKVIENSSSASVFEDLKKLYVKHFRPALMMEYQMLEQLPNGYNPELSKRQNLVWDEQIMMVLSNTSHGEPFILVTHDKDMFKAAQAQQKDVGIVNLLEYLTQLNVACPNEIYNKYNN